MGLTPRAADLLMAAHFAWVLFMVLGLPLGLLLRSPPLRWIHLAGMALTGAIAALGWWCPLTLWEEELRLSSGDGGYGGGFLAYWVERWLYPDLDPRWLRAGSVAWGGLTILSMVIWRPDGRRRPRPLDNAPPPGIVGKGKEKILFFLWGIFRRGK